MKKLILCLTLHYSFLVTLLLLCSNSFFAQADPPQIIEESALVAPLNFKENFDVWATKNAKVSPVVIKSKVQGYIAVDFTVAKDGKVKNVKLGEDSPLQNVTLGMEAMRIIKLTNNSWGKGSVADQAVNVTIKRYLGFFIDKKNKYNISLFKEDEKIKGTVSASTYDKNQLISNEATGASEFFSAAEYKSSYISSPDNASDSLLVYDQVETTAAFNGSYKNYLERVFQYPEEAIEAGIRGPVEIKFLVSEDGLVSHVTLAKTSPQKNEVLIKEAVRFIRLSSGLWRPGKVKGKTVNSFDTRTITFAYAEE